MTKLETGKRWIIWLVSIPIRAYRYFLSPLFGPHCRFHPTCSSYFLQALNDYGLLKGGYLGIKRLLKCHPGNAGGYDPVPGHFHCDDSSGKAQRELLNKSKNQHSETIT